MLILKNSPVYVGGALLFWLLITVMTALNWYRDPDFNAGLWAIPAVGFLFLIGVVVSASLEADKDLAWKDKPPASDDEVNDGKSKLADAFRDGNISIVGQPTMEVRDGHRIDGWNGWRYRLEYLLSGILGFAVIFLALSLLGWHRFAGAFGGLLPVASGFVLGRIRKNTIYVNELKLVDHQRANFRESQFYDYQRNAAERLGLREIGDYRQVNFKRTIFANYDQTMVLEIDRKQFKITSATAEGRLLQTSTSGNNSETEKAIQRIVPPIFGASGQTRWKTLSAAIQKHIDWVSAHLAQVDSPTLLVLNAANLKLILEEANCTRADDWSK